MPGGPGLLYKANSARRTGRNHVEALLWKGDARCPGFPSSNSCTFNRPKAGIRRTIGLVTSHLVSSAAGQSGLTNTMTLPERAAFCCCVLALFGFDNIAEIRYRRRIVEIYAVHKPDNVHKVDYLLEKHRPLLSSFRICVSFRKTIAKQQSLRYRGDEEFLYRSICEKCPVHVAMWKVHRIE